MRSASFEVVKFWSTSVRIRNIPMHPQNQNAKWITPLLNFIIRLPYHASAKGLKNTLFFWQVVENLVKKPMAVNLKLILRCSQMKVSFMHGIVMRKGSAHWQRKYTMAAKISIGSAHWQRKCALAARNCAFLLPYTVLCYLLLRCQFHSKLAAQARVARHSGARFLSTALNFLNTVESRV